MPQREAWMLPRDEMIGRSLDPQPAGSGRAHARGRLAFKRASMLLACIAIVAAFVSGAVLVSLGGSEDATLQPEVPDTASPLAPPPPYSVFGYTEDGVGDPIPYCTVTITNTNTGEYAVVESDSIGWYQLDIMNALPTPSVTGDVITVVAVSDALQLTGENQGTVDLESAYQYLWLDITLDVVIPEFSMLIVPVAGVMMVFAAMGIRRRNRQ